MLNITSTMSKEEQARLKDLAQYRILDTDQEDDYNDIANLAAMICNTPISFISLIDADRQWFKARYGIEERETPRSIAFCNETIKCKDLLVVENAILDERFRDNPLVTGTMKIRFYAGYPLISANGYCIGTLGVADRESRILNKQQTDSLIILAGQVERLLELRLKNKEIEKHKSSLLELDSFKNDILRIVSHDLRSPLSSIETMIHLLQHQMLSSGDLDKIIVDISGRVNNAKTLINDLFSWADNISVQQQVYSTKVKLYQLVEHELLMANDNIQNKNNLVLNKVDDELSFYSDGDMLSFIIRNLIINANKFTENGKITIEAKESNEYLHISVCDNGVGMTKEEVEHLFDSNKKRKSGSGTRNERGLGVGLLLVKRFVDLLRGEIYCESSKNIGTTIYLKFPKV